MRLSTTLNLTDGIDPRGASLTVRLRGELSDEGLPVPPATIVGPVFAGVEAATGFANRQC